VRWLLLQIILEVWTRLSMTTGQWRL